VENERVRERGGRGESNHRRAVGTEICKKLKKPKK